MEQLFNDLQTQIKQCLKESVSLIDEDCGQLEALQNGEDQYPVTFPCVLIGNPEVQWEALKSDMQHGRATLTIRLAFDCYEDTRYGSPQTNAVGERLHLASLLNSYLHGWVFDGCSTALIRRVSRQFSLPGGIKVYEMEYTTTMNEKIQKPSVS